ncbi:hypothetical protein B0A50_07780 [Salinomyces thailandicus]|uniref:Prokaryotic-type class I peptide chain release factors domain-containing protein n=1 Tax=Salinomyces thailandicus TaxID=706561 RepID=A0A4U0TLH7_9PEZI|nr:hypothetical protein B0A50_07780 [Salinomyces thailandica]
MLRRLQAYHAFTHPLPFRIKTQSFTTSPQKLKETPLPPRPIIPESDLHEAFLKGSGPGGQKINKTSSAVQLKHLPTGIVVKSQETRSREQNRKLARNLLKEKLDWLEKGEGSRGAIKAERERGKRASRVKKARRKYKRLEGEKIAMREGGGGGGGGDEGVESVGKRKGDGEERSVDYGQSEPREEVK